MTTDPTPQRIYLIGYRAVGKTSTAQALARKLEWDWCDSDVEIAKQARKTIAKVFKDSGEPEFRRIESAMLLELAKREQTVVSTGGGVILAAENRNLISHTGVVIWLTADVEVIQQRMADDEETTCNRPALLGVDVMTEVRDVLEQRKALYRECADFEVDTADRSPSEVADLIMERLHSAFPDGNGIA